MGLHGPQSRRLRGKRWQPFSAGGLRKTEASSRWPEGLSAQSQQGCGSPPGQSGKTPHCAQCSPWSQRPKVTDCHRVAVLVEMQAQERQQGTDCGLRTRDRSQKGLCVRNRRRASHVSRSQAQGSLVASRWALGRFEDCVLEKLTRRKGPAYKAPGHPAWPPLWQTPLGHRKPRELAQASL